MDVRLWSSTEEGGLILSYELRAASKADFGPGGQEEGVSV